MTMSFLLHDLPGDIETSEFREPTHRIRKATRRHGGRLTLLNEKLHIPQPGTLVERPGLMELISRSGSNFAATLISGRAGTGKTAVAATFASKHGNAVWYAIEPSDDSWPAFSQYFIATLRGPVAAKRSAVADMPDQPTIDKLLSRAFQTNKRAKDQQPLLIVLDDIHHLFDAAWFSTFFQQLIVSLPSEAHLLMTCRSKPPAPLWRLRSKQVLNVVEEDILAFTLAEARQLGEMYDAVPKVADDAHRRSFGHVSKLIETLKNVTGNGHIRS